jgi:hypothetical protein
MTPGFLLLIIELIGLFIISRKLTKTIFLFFLLLTRSRPFAIAALTALLFPGTVIHELSHLFTAELLMVKTGKLTLVPEGIEGNRIQTGSVEIAHTDPFRRSVIGLAPFFIGIITLCILSSFVPMLWEQTLAAYGSNRLFTTSSSYFLLLLSYLIVCVSNSMFTSPEDMQGVIPLGIVLSLLGFAVYATGFRILLPEPIVHQISTILSAVTNALIGVLLLNVLLFVFASAAIWLLKGKVRKG